MRNTPKVLASNQAMVLLIQGLEFFPEACALEVQMTPSDGNAGAVAIVPVHDVHQITSTAITWLESYAHSREKTTVHI